MTAPLPGKYQLKTLHEEIDLFDRKLAHLMRYQEFACDADRNAAARSLANKREQLVRAAQQMVSDGIEYNDAELPRSFRIQPDPAAPAAELTQVEGEPEATSSIAPRPRTHPSPYAGTSLDFRKGLQEYKRKRKKA